MPVTDRARLVVICNDSAYFLRHRRVVVDALAERGHDVTVVTGGPRIDPGIVGRWRYVNTPIERFTFSPRLDVALAWKTFRGILRRKPAAVHLITLKPGVVSGLAAIAARVVSGKPDRLLITIPGLGRLMSPSSLHRGARAMIARSLVRRIIRFLSARRGVVFTFETDSDRDNWLENGLVRAENSVVINGAGVDGALFHPAASDVDRGGRMRVLFASRLLRSKGLDAFVAAARSMASEEVEFIVAGMSEPGDRDSYGPSELAAEKAVTFLGEVTDMPALLRSVHVACLPTRYGEGIPRILIEAAASGLPCIASDLDGCREIVKDGHNGLIIPVTERAAMATALVEAVRRYRDDAFLREEHGRAGRGVFLAGGFSEANVVDRFVGLLIEG